MTADNLSAIIVKDTLYVDAGELRERNATNGVGIKLRKLVSSPTHPGPTLVHGDIGS